MQNPRDWWRGSVIYQIYPRSFMDANNDGVGDLAGITDKIDYLAWLGIDAIWISPFFASPMRDFGYDVSDYRQVDPIFGNLDDFDVLINRAHSHNIKIIVDLVVSHTSNQHDWFRQSATDRTNPKSDWYVWADAKPDGTPPNNWLSHFGGSAWTWNAKRRQYYFHNFLAEQPDLNYHNPEVRDAVMDIFRFWLDRGVDGFRLDTVNMYFHDKLLRDNPPCPPEEALSDYDPYDFQIHLYDKSQPENLVFLEELRRLTDEYPDKMLVGEIGGAPASVAPLLVSYTEAGKRLHMSYVFDLIYGKLSPEAVKRVVERLAALTNEGWICWSLSNHDVQRVVTRWDWEREGVAVKAVPMAVAMITSLRGSACIYQGEELGLPEADIPYELIQDPHGKVMWPEFKGRDGSRTPFPWRHDLPHAGFSGGATWLPVPEVHKTLAVDLQKGDPLFILNRCRRFLAWRKSVPPLLDGNMCFLDLGPDILAFERTTGDYTVVAIFNLGNEMRLVRLHDTVEPLTGHGFGARMENGLVELDGFDVFFGRI